MRILLLTLCLIFQASQTMAAEAKNRCYSKFSEVLECYIAAEDGAYSYEFLEEASKHDYSILTYHLNSQNWPLEEQLDIPTTTWHHKLRYYVPQTVKFSTALLYITGGYTANSDGEINHKPPRETFDFAAVARENKAVVIVLEAVPNQYLSLGGQWLKEDQIVAYTFKKVMEDPLNKAYLAAHLPMTKAVVKAMDTSQRVLADRGITIKEFVVSGASKRGWTAWLTSLADDRVKAIIPLVIDILNIKESIKNICNSHLNSCPPALKDYQKEGLIDRIDSPEFISLAMIEDPYMYLRQGEKFKRRLSIPKYIVNASGDDFFSPNGSDFYLKSLPGKNTLRVLPQAMHYFVGNPISDNLGNKDRFNNIMNVYFKMVLNNIAAPSMTWNFNEDSLDIKTSQKPIKVTLWSAFNERERDFRFLNSYGKTHLVIKTALLWLSTKLGFSYDACDNCYYSKDIEVNCPQHGQCQMHIALPKLEKGWRAAFVEVTHSIGHDEFTQSTGVDIFPQSYPLQKY